MIRLPYVPDVMQSQAQPLSKHNKIGGTMIKYALFAGLLVAALLTGFLSASASPPPAPADLSPTDSNLSKVSLITVDGVVDDDYGPPIASDPAGDHWAGDANLDLLDLYVTDDSSNFYVAFTVNDDIITTDWGKYVLYLDTTNDANGATSDAWNRNVIVNDPHKPEFGLYTWVDAPPYGPDHTQLVAWTGSGWDWLNVKQATAAVLASTGVTSTIEYQIAKADLGNPDTLWVEVWDTGGGDNDNAQDTINDPADDWNATDWATQAVLACSTPFTATTPSQPPGHDDNVWWDGLEHDSRSDVYRQPFGAVITGTPITLRFRTFANDVTGVQVRLWDTALESQTIYPMSHLSTIPGAPFDYDVWELQLDAPDYLTVLYYRFLVTDGGDTDYYEDDDLFDGGLGQPYNDSPDNSWQIDVYHPDFDTPDWFKDAVVYQIFPDRFRNGLGANDPISGTFFYAEDPGTLTAPQWNWIVPDPRVSGPWEGSYSKLFYGGDLQGLIDKLDYLQAQGITTLYLNPIFESPSNHKYDTTNYEEVDDNFGNLATYISLTNELESRGMHLVLDGVFNHTSSDSHYFDRYGRYPGFVGACEDLNSPYRDWYYFSPADPPGTGACAGDTNYQAWWGFDSLPKLNTTDNPEVRGYIYSDTLAIATYWLEQGADGWRLDVAGDVHPSFWQDWRAYIRNANPDAITIAEEWGDASHFILGDELDSSMNYRFRNAVIGLLRGAEWPNTDWQDTNAHIRSLSVSQFDSLMHSIQEDYPPEAFYAMMNLVGSHDTNRVLLPLSLQDTDADPTTTDFGQGKDRLRALAIVQMTMPGAPTVYYGDEVGLVGYGDEDGGGVYYADPYNRQPYPWPDEPGYGSLPAWRQQDLSLHAHYSATANIRNAHPALRTGSFDTLLVDDEAGLYAYGRKLGNDAALVALNLGPTQSLTLTLNGYLPDGTALSDELNGDTPYTVSGGQIGLNDVPHLWGAILTVDAGQDLTPPDPPSNLAAVEGDGAVYLNWTAPVSPTSAYHVYRSYVPGGGYTRIATGTVGTAYTDTNVTNGQWYYYVVAALDASGNESDLSNQAAALPHADIDWAGELEPASLTHTIGLTPTQPISAQVWISGVTDLPGQGEGVLAELGFGLSGTLTSTWPVWMPMDYVDDVGNNDQYAARFTPEMTGTLQYLARFSTTGGRDWTYAPTAGGQPGVMTVLASADVTPPVTPVNLRLQDWSAGWLELAWDPVEGDPSLYAYDLFRSEVSDTIGSHVARVLAPTTVYTDTDVSTGQTYYYRVQAVDTSFNRSGYSNQVEATPQAKVVAVTFQATVPDYTPEDATVYVVGDIPELCGWCNPQTVALSQTGEVTWSRVITLADGQAIQYKYTRGNWNVNEWWGPIYSVYNREATVDYGGDGSQLLADVVHYWRDPLVISHDPAAGATGLDPATVVSATLSRYLDASTINADNLVLHSAVETPTLDVGFFYHTQMTATTILLTPTTPLAEGARYTVSLKTGLTGRQDDNEGVSLQREYRWSFRVLSPNLSLDKTVEPTLDVPLGGVVTYTIVLSNIGDGPANGTVMTDRLPLGVGFGGWLDQGSALLPDPPGDTITWGPYSLPAGEDFTFRFTATVTTSATYYGQTITNVAHYRHAGGQGSDSAPFVIEDNPTPPEPVLSIFKTVKTIHDPVQLGEPITYTITVVNTGLGDAAGVVVSDALPLGVIGNDLSWTGTVSASDQVSLVIAASLISDTMYYGQTITNTAHYSHISGGGFAWATFVIESGPIAYRAYLPLVLRNTP